MATTRTLQGTRDAIDEAVKLLHDEPEALILLVKKGDHVTQVRAADIESVKLMISPLINEVVKHEIPSLLRGLDRIGERIMKEQVADAALASVVGRSVDPKNIN